MPNYPVPTAIYHFTHIGNLARLIQIGAILCKNEMTAHRIDYTTSAYESVQNQRQGCHVPVSQGGTIHDYVPFYFTSLSPMLFTISRGNVANINMSDLVFFRSSAQAVELSGADFAFTDGHGIMELSEYYDDLSDLGQVPWSVIQARYWNDFPDGRRLRQSEFLVHRRFAWDLVDLVGVYTPEMQVIVTSVISNLQHQPIVEVKRGWYF